MASGELGLRLRLTMTTAVPPIDRLRGSDDIPGNRAVGDARGLARHDCRLRPSRRTPDFKKARQFITVRRGAPRGTESAVADDDGSVTLDV
jgi:hypothetical protein